MIVFDPVTGKRKIVFTHEDVKRGLNRMREDPRCIELFEHIARERREWVDALVATTLKARNR